MGRLTSSSFTDWLQQGQIAFRADGLVFPANIQSSNFSAGISGWSIMLNGDAEFNDGTFRGDVDINPGDDNEVLIDGDGLSVGDRGSTRYIWMKNWSSGASSAINIEMKLAAYTMLYGAGIVVTGMEIGNGAVEMQVGIGGTDSGVGGLFNGEEIFLGSGGTARIIMKGSTGLIDALGYKVNGTAGVDGVVIAGINTLTFSKGILTNIA